MFFYTGVRNKTCNIKADDMITVQICFEAFIFRNLIRLKQSSGIRGSVIIRTQHLRSESFSKSPGPADASEIVSRIHPPIQKSNQTGLVNIFTVYNILKPNISRIKICSHS